MTFASRLSRVRALAAGIAVAVAIALVPVQSFAQDKGQDKANKADDDALYSCNKQRGKFRVNLKDEVELRDLITWAMSFRCENFIYGSGIAGRKSKVIMITPKQMTAGQAWKLFLVAMQNMGVTVVKKGNTLEIVEVPQTKRYALPIYKGAPPRNDQVVRAIIRPEHLGANELVSVLNELKSKDGEVKSIPNANIIVVTDFGAHIARMREVARSVDRPVVGERLYMIKVEHADAAELATRLTDLLGTKEAKPVAASTSSSRAKRRRDRRKNRKNPSPVSSASTDEVESAVPSKIVADERTNSLIVLASEPAYVRVRSLVKRLDVAVDVEGSGRIHVYVLQHADAEEMGQTLQSVISGIPQQSGSGSGSQGSRNNRNARNTRNNRTSAATPGAAAFEGQVRVSHDKPTNSLVIVASVKDFMALRKVIQRLDINRPQVYIEANIIEVNAENGRDLGVSFHGGKLIGDEGALAIGGLQHSQLSTIGIGVDASSLLGIQGLLGGLLGPLLPETGILPGLSLPTYGVLVQALATSGNVNILSTPHIMTSDNEEAEISVGQNIPYQAGQVGIPGASSTTALGFQSIQRQDVALTLKITPQINASDNIRLDIDLEISDIASENFGGLGPSWARRTIKDTVQVKDQETVVIGGLMQDRVTTSESKIPLLGDIPILGYLFKYKSKSKTKTNLLVMLTPYVIKDQADLARIKQRRVREQREFMETFETFDRLGDKAEVDYRRKRGLLAEINKVIATVDRETEIRLELQERRIDRPDGLIDYTDEELEDEAKEKALKDAARDEAAQEAVDQPATEGIPTEGN